MTGITVLNRNDGSSYLRPESSRSPDITTAPAFYESPLVNRDAFIHASQPIPLVHPAGKYHLPWQHSPDIPSSYPSLFAHGPIDKLDNHDEAVERQEGRHLDTKHVLDWLNSESKSDGKFSQQQKGHIDGIVRRCWPALLKAGLLESFVRALGVAFEHMLFPSDTSSNRTVLNEVLDPTLDGRILLELLLNAWLSEDIFHLSSIDHPSHWLNISRWRTACQDLGDGLRKSELRFKQRGPIKPDPLSE